MVKTSSAWALRGLIPAAAAGHCRGFIGADIDGSGSLGTRGAGKNHGRAIALMDIAIDRHRGANLVVTLHAADGDGHVVDHAEAFAVIGNA